MNTPHDVHDVQYHSVYFWEALVFAV